MNYQSHNAQFAFLKPNHILHTFFLDLVEQYKLILHFDDSIKNPLISKYKRREESLHVAVHHIEHRREEERRKKENERRNELDIQTVDWDDFVVVETITFDDESQFVPSSQRLHQVGNDMTMIVNYL